MMQPFPTDVVATKRKARDAWSPTFVAVSAACALVVVLLLLANPVLMLPLVGIVLPALVVPLGWLCYDLVTFRFRHALSIVAAAAAAVGVVYCSLLITQRMAQRADTSTFHSRLPEFERQVEEARAKRTTQEPLQIVLDTQDRSPFALTNSFYYVIYDETDGMGPYNNTYWPHAGSSAGVTRVYPPTEMRRLTGHYYDFSTSY